MRKMPGSGVLVALSLVVAGACADVDLGSDGFDAARPGPAPVGTGGTGSGETGQGGAGGLGAGGAANGGAASGFGGSQATGGTVSSSGRAGVDAGISGGSGGGATGTAGVDLLPDAALVTDTRLVDPSGIDAATVQCAFSASIALSPAIGSVAVVEWATDLAPVVSARIEFGPTTTYGMTAPVDLAAANHRTLLLGMKPGNTYHYRVVASDGSAECASADFTLANGPLSPGLPKLAVATQNAAALFGGFLITGDIQSTSGSNASAYILDQDGDCVWAMAVTPDATSARMSYDGAHMWINSSNVPATSARVHRVSMDGASDDDLSTVFAGQHHQLAVLPDETVAFFSYGSNGCEDIKEYSPRGAVRTVVNAGTAQGVSSGCYVTNLEYSRDDDTLVFSDTAHQSLVKVKRSDGSTAWVLNGSTATFTGDSWLGGQTGLHVLGLDDLVIFNHNTKSLGSAGGGDGSGSMALELKLDLTARKVVKDWTYKASPGLDDPVIGDVQRLPNGNTVVAYSTLGILHEVDARGAVLQTWTWPGGASFGYVEKRATLYGPPPR